ncbi:MAG: alpha/beta hydrolase [Ilumatobacteraceae bacterium]|jgi:acetyl esterase/lipase|nr:alpha/beta hydrolase [Ilumatobacteraceae bacterium]
MASPQAEMFKDTVRQFRAQLEAGGVTGPPDLGMLRAADATTGDTTVAPEGVEYSPGAVGGVSGVWVEPIGADPGRTILYLHGGGYVVGSSETHRKMVGHLAKAAGVRSFVADYRLAPEAPHPAALDDALAIYRALLADGTDPGRIVVAGDSAGGGLAVALLVAARDTGLPQPAGAIVFSPWVDLAGTGETMQTRVDVDLMVTAELAEMMAAHYLAGADPRTPTASPLYADLHGLAPMCIQVGDEEVLLADSTRLADRLRAAGVDVELEVFPEMQHVFQIAAGLLPESDDAIAKAGAFARRVASG